MRRLLVAGFVLALLFVVADRVAVAVAQGKVAARLQATEALPAPPAVQVSGFPFLTQAVAGRYDRVVVTATGVPLRGGLRASRISAELRGVQLPLRAALAGSVTAVPVASVTATVQLSRTDLDSALAANGSSVRVLPAAGGLRLEGAVTVLGRTITASGTATAELAADRLVLHASQLRVTGSGVDPALTAALAGRLDVSLPVGRLPFGLHLTTAQADAGGVAISAAAGPTVLRQP